MFHDACLGKGGQSRLDAVTVLRSTSLRHAPSLQILDSNLPSDSNHFGWGDWGAHWLFDLEY